MNFVARLFLLASFLVPTLVVPTLVVPTVASAQAECPVDYVGCHTGDVDFHHRDALFDGVMIDTGWVPSGSALQARFAVYVGGSTEVDLGGTAVTSWPAALDVAVPGRPGTGRLAIDYGIEIVARVRFDVTVLGVRYTWESDILSGIPSDLRMADELIFDPFVLPPSDPRPVVVYDETAPVRIYNLGLSPITGVSGGFAVDAVASLEASYRTNWIDIGDAVTPIEIEGASSLVRPDMGLGGFGAAKDLIILPNGTIDYDGVVTLTPRFYIEVVGRRFDLPIADIPVPLVDIGAATDFAPATVHVPLPDIRVEPRSLSFPDLVRGEVADDAFTIHNDGEATLEVTVGEVESPFSAGATTITLAPGASEVVTVSFSPIDGGPANAILLVGSNDPDQPVVTVRLDGFGAGDWSDAGVADGGISGDGGFVPVDGGCACRASAPSGAGRHAWLLLPLFGLLVWRRRRLS